MIGQNVDGTKPVGTSKTNASPEPLAVNIKTACHITGLSRSSMYRLIDSGALQSRRVLGRRLVLLASIRKLFENEVAKR